MSRHRFSESPIRTLTVLGRKVEIYVDRDGVFYTRIGTDSLKGDTLKAVVSQVQRSVKKTRIAIAMPATLIGVQKYGERSAIGRPKVTGMTCEPIMVVGLNPKQTSELQYRRADGLIERGARYSRYGVRFGKPMTSDQVSTFERLWKAKDAAEDAYSTFVERFEWKDIHEAVVDALAAAVDDPKEGETDADTKDDQQPAVARRQGSRRSFR